MASNRKFSADFDLKILRQFPPSRKYLIGVSGGRDSVVLFRQLVERGYGRLVVCHLDHRLRGTQSRADARFVEKLGQQHGLDVEIGSTDVRVFAAKKKMSIETAGREARYQFFAEVARRQRCRTIFLGHHADDLAETFLINLFRGSGMSGLASMREIAIRPINKIELTIVRPLLGVWREQIDLYVRANHLKFREDVTNASLGPLRNRVRRRIIPYLEKQFGRPIRKSIWRAASIALEEEAFFDELFASSATKSTQLAVGPLREMPKAVQRRMLHEWLRTSKVANLNFDLVERVRALLDLSNQVAKTNLPGRLHARRRSGAIFME